MEEAVNSQRSSVFFLWKEGASGTEITRRLINVFGESAMQKTAVYKWLNRFENRRSSLEDDARVGRPATTLTPKNIKGEYIEKYDVDDV